MTNGEIFPSPFFKMTGLTFLFCYWKLFKHFNRNKEVLWSLWSNFHKRITSLWHTKSLKNTFCPFLWNLSLLETNYTVNGQNDFNRRLKWDTVRFCISFSSKVMKKYGNSLGDRDWIYVIPIPDRKFPLTDFTSKFSITY